MPHLTVNGITFPGQADSLEEEPQYVGEALGRSSNGAMLESRTTRKRMWRLRSVFLTPTEANGWQRTIEGDGHYWRLGTTAVSTKGRGPNVGGTYNFTTFAPPTGSAACIQVGSGSSIKWSMGSALGPGWSPESGFTISVYARKSATEGDIGTAYYRYLVTGTAGWNQGTANPSNVTQYRNGTSGTYGVGYWLDLTTAGVLGLYGFGDSAGAANAKSYAYLTILPFALPSAWVSGLASHTETMRLAVLPFISELPRVVLAGDAIPDANGVNAIGRVRSLGQRNVNLAGSQRNNARVIEVEFFEV